MLPSFVTIGQAKAHVLVDHDSDDAQLQSMIEQASAIILDYLKLASVPASWTDGTGSTGDSPSGAVPPLIQAATLLIIGELYRTREAADINVLSAGIKSLLHRYRDPSLA